MAASCSVSVDVLVVSDLVLARDGHRVGNGHGQRFIAGVWTGLLMWRPWTLHRLAGDLEVLDHLGPGPDRGALSGFRGVLDELVDPGIAPAASGRVFAHAVPTEMTPEPSGASGQDGRTELTNNLLMPDPVRVNSVTGHSSLHIGPDRGGRDQGISVGPEVSRLQERPLMESSSLTTPRRSITLAAGSRWST
jgi:hypothetical protein